MKLKEITIIGPDEKSIGGVSEVNRQILESKFLQSQFAIRIIRTWNGKSLMKIYPKSFIQFLLNYKTTDLFHIDLSSNGSFYRKILFMITISKDKSFIIHLHGGAFFDFYRSSSIIIKKLIIHAFTKAELVCCVSNSARQQVINVLGINKNKVRYLYNGVDIAEREMPEKNEKLQILYLGSLTDFRGLGQYLNIADYYKSEDELVFYIAGAGDKNILLGHNVKYLGIISGAIKEKVLNETDILVNFCKNESFGIGMIEGMNHYSVIIGFNGGSIPEILGNGEFGDVVQTEQGAIDLINKYINDKESLRKKQIKSYKRSKDFSICRFEDGLFHIYSKLILKGI